ncbi:uncharacterized protein LOC110117227 [Athalia rosae]|uniref:uncharacterized protein LOC110117227 n=1 Tax=Athalia rosae TaxID=37344 RepID=UPI0020333C4D|nr:uncharacterized protein LOC110117227 [Athalia rosae]
MSMLFNAAELQKLKQALHVTDVSCVPQLLCAVVLEKSETVKRLLKDGHYVDSCAEDKSTPLMWAVHNKNLEIINVLIQHDADPTLLDNDINNSALIAIQSACWDENDFLDFWKTISSRIDIDHGNIRGNTILHYAIKRQWNVLVDQILETTANVNCANAKGVTPLMMAGIRVNSSMVSALLRSHADVFQEDSKGCTALCYSIACSMQKKFKAPHPSLQKLVCTVNTVNSNLTIESYLKRRLELLIHPPVLANNFISTVNSIIRSVFEFFIQHIQSGLKILLNLDAFGKIQEAVDQHMCNWLHLEAILGILIELLCYSNCGTSGNISNISETELMDLFTTAGLPDTCLRILKRYAADSKTRWVVASGLEPLFAKCTAHGKAREWLRKNYHHLEPYYSGCPSKSNELSRKLTKRDRQRNLCVKTMKFRYLISKYKQGDKSVTLQSPPESARHESNRSIGEHPSTTSVGSSKRQRHKIKTLKMKLAKIKGMTLTERKSSSTQSEAGINYVATSTRSTPSGDVTACFDLEYSSSQTNLVSDSLHRANDNGPQRPAQNAEKIETVSGHTANNMSLTKISTGTVHQRTHTDDSCPMNKMELLEVGGTKEFQTSPTFNEPLECILQGLNASTSCDTISSFSQLNENRDYPNDGTVLGHTNDLDETDNINEYAIGNVETTISYLSTLFEGIISSYKRNWQRDRELGYPGYKGRQSDHMATTEEQLKIKTEEIARLNTILPKLEDTCIEKLTESWLSLMTKIRQTANKNVKKFKSVIALLHLHLLTYQIFPKEDLDQINNSSQKDGSIGDERMMKEESDSVHQSIGDIYGQESYQSREIQHHSTVYSTNNFCSKSVPDNGFGETVVEQYPLKSQVHQSCNNDESLASPGNTKATIYTAQVIEALQTQVTVNSTTHTVAEMLQTHSTGVYSSILSTHPFLHMHTTTAAPLTFSKDSASLIENDRTLEIHMQPTNWGASKNQTYISRWDMLINGLKARYNHRSHPSSQIVLSGTEQRKHYTISPGGNFGPVEVGLDRDGSPFAIRRIQKEDSRLILPSLASVLSFRHNHLLPYLICMDGGTEIILGTPLCEYNLGEYLMFLKMSAGLKQRSLVLVKQFLAGLSFLHSHNVPVIHGNIKPSNLMIDRAGVLRLAEFGLWKSLYWCSRPPSSSMIWFARESYEAYEDGESFNCTCATDIQVSGMMVHFILTGGLHPFGTQTGEIIESIIKGYPRIQYDDCEISDLMSWMLVFDPVDRPSINQILTHVCFWDTKKKWSFLLACAGITADGTDLPLPLDAVHGDLEAKAVAQQVPGDWLSAVQTQFPTLMINEDEYSDSPTGLLVFVRKLLKSKPTPCPSTIQKFFMGAFPTLPLSLYRLLETTQWLSHPVFTPFFKL